MLSALKPTKLALYSLKGILKINYLNMDIKDYLMKVLTMTIS